MNLEIQISLADVRLILGQHFDAVFKKAIKNNTCRGCKRDGDAELVIKEIWLNHIGDIIVEGWCKDCGFKLSRYIEANNYPGAYDQAIAIRELKRDVLKDYNVRPPGY